MKEQNQSYRRLREQLDQHEFGLPPSSWEQMAEILDGKQPVPQPQPVEKGRKRRGFWWLLFAGLLFIGGGLGAQYLNGWPAWQASATRINALPIPTTSTPRTKLMSTPKANPPVATQERPDEKSPSTNLAAPPPAAPDRTASTSSQAAAPTAKQSLGMAEDRTAVQPSSELPKRPKSQPLTNTQPLPNPTVALAQLPAAPVNLRTEQPAAFSPELATPVPNRAFHFGLKAGLDAQFRQTTGLVGLFARYRLSGKWALQLEPQYKLRSDKLGQGLGLDAAKEQTIYYPTAVQSTSRAVSITRLHFFELPLTALYQIHPKLQLIGGGQLVHLRSFSRNTSQERAVSSNVLYEDQRDLSVDGSPGIVSWDAGLILGADYQLTPSLSLDLRYVQGLYDLTHDAFFLKKEDYLNSSIQLSIKWRW